MKYSVTVWLTIEAESAEAADHEAARILSPASKEGASGLTWFTVESDLTTEIESLCACSEEGPCAACCDAASETAAP